jgi:uncharacterized protein (DUF608 family)
MIVMNNSSNNGGNNGGTNENTGRKFPKKWIWLGVAVLLALWCLNSYRSMANAEIGIRQQNNRIVNAIDSLVKKLEAQGSVVKNYSATLRETITAYVSGRGSKAGSLMTAVGEAIPQIPPATWESLSQTINAEYEALESAQNTKVAKLESYEKTLANPVHWPMKLLGGFPKIDLEEENRLILGTTARDAQKTKTLETIDPLKGK